MTPEARAARDAKAMERSYAAADVLRRRDVRSLIGFVDGARLVEQALTPGSDLYEVIMRRLPRMMYEVPLRTPRSPGKSALSLGIHFDFLRLGQPDWRAPMDLWTDEEDASPFVALLRNMGHANCSWKPSGDNPHFFRGSVIHVSDTLLAEEAVILGFETMRALVHAFDVTAGDWAVLDQMDVGKTTGPPRAVKPPEDGWL